jgi:hypothetical protein
MWLFRALDILSSRSDHVLESLLPLPEDINQFLPWNSGKNIGHVRLKLFERRPMTVSEPSFDIAEERSRWERYPVNMADEGALLTLVSP